MCSSDLPLARELGIHSGAGCMGPGFRANATIGRAITLAMLNIARAIPGRSDLSSFGSPAEYSYCFAETDENHPWQPFHVEFRDAATTTVTVHKVEGPHNVIAHLGPRPEDILQAVSAQAATIAGNNYSWPFELIVLLNPAHARSIAAAGWSKADVRRRIWEGSMLPAHRMAAIDLERTRTGRSAELGVIGHEIGRAHV